MTYFTDCKTVEDIKKRYRELAKKHHPDLGGSTETMKQINLEYHAALKRKHKSTSTGSDGKEHTYYYNEDHEQAIIDMIAQVLAAPLPEYVTVMLIGKWLWITGSKEGDDTRDVLKALDTEDHKWKWHRKRSAWYWKPTNGRRRYNRNASLSDLAYKYGHKKWAARQKYNEDKERASKPALNA